MEANMREFFLELLGEKLANEHNGISMFSWTHILYLVLIVGIIVALSIIFFKKEESTKTKVLNILAILIAVSYISDFFFQPFWHNGTFEKNGELILDKFPFHICTVLCPLVLYSRFGKYGKGIKTPLSVLAVVAPLMWLIYPGTALDTDLAAYSYEIVQLFMYHGLVLIYGVCALTLNESKLNIKKCYKEALCVLGITLWGALGNSLYSCENHGYNWFFLKDPVFGFIPESVNPFVVPIVVFLSCLVIYGVYYLVIFLYNKFQKESVKEVANN